MSPLLFFSAIIGFASADITFVATKNVNLSPIPFDEAPSVGDIFDAVSLTKAYGTIFEASPISFSEQFDENPRLVDERPDVELVRGSNLTVDGLKQVRPSPYGFAGSILEAYARHHNVRLRPDDVWLAILSQFSAYFQARSEILRDKVVDFEGQKTLEVRVQGSMRTYPDWSFFPPAFLDLIAENVKNATVREWFLPDFTTTTEKDKVAAAATAMCTFQDFFKYSITFICGIPQVTLLGSVEDWEEILARSGWLAEFDDGTGVITEKWLPLLQEVLREFVESSKTGSDNNLSFWDQIAHSYQFPYSGRSLSGWITVFTYFGVDGNVLVNEDSIAMNLPLAEVPTDFPKWGTLAPDDVNEGVLSCPIEITDIDNEKYNSTLFVGQMTFEKEPDFTASLGNPALQLGSESSVEVVSPRTEWAIVVHTQELVEKTRPSENDFFDGRPTVLLCSDSRFEPLCLDPTFSGLEDLCERRFTFAPSQSIVPASSPAPTRRPRPKFCFSSNSMLEVQGEGPVSISEVKIGDVVKSNKDSFSRIYSFGHRKESADADFVQIHYKTNRSEQKMIEMTEDHMLSINGSMMPASSVKVGDLLDDTSGTAVVTDIRQVHRTGVYGPFTEEGTIMVNGVLVSNYVAVQQNLGELKVFGWNTGLCVHDLAHRFESFHRTVCHLLWSVCEQEEYTSEGISWWLAVPYYFASWLPSQENDEAMRTCIVTVFLSLLIAGRVIRKVSSKCTN